MSNLYKIGAEFNNVYRYYTPENITFLSNLITETIAQSYSGKKVVVPDEDIVREMQYVADQLVESTAKMNRRVVMNVVRSFLDFVEDNIRKNEWNDTWWFASRGPLDGSLGIRSFDTPKLRQNLNYTRQFAKEFYFTY